MMRVANWCHSLAVRRSAQVVDLPDVMESGKIEFHVAAARESAIARNSGREELLMRLRAFLGRLPPDFTFDRDEANAR